MSVIGDTLQILESSLAAGFGSTGIGVACVSDLTTEHDRLFPGAWYYQLSAAYTGVDRALDANTTLHGYEITIWIRHRLADATLEDNWTRSQAFEDLVRWIGNPSSYRAGTYGVGTNPDFYDFQRGNDALVLTAQEREGNVISVSARAKILLKR